MHHDETMHTHEHTHDHEHPHEEACGHDCHTANLLGAARLLKAHENELEGMVKLMADAATGLILGCHGYGAHTADMVQEVASLICRHTTLSQLADITHIHPTLGEMVQELAG